MMEEKNRLIPPETNSENDAQAIKHLEQSITAGKHWFIALLESFKLWTSAEELHHDRTYRYLIDGEAFDWLLLAERLCETVDWLLPEAEKNALLFQGKPPLNLTADEVKEYIGAGKYVQYLNYFYGVVIEGALLLAVQEDVDKERLVLSLRTRHESDDEAFRRIYDVTRPELLKIFRQEKGYSQEEALKLSALKEFTYWSFKYRLKRCEKAKIASDTKKALAHLKRQWRRKGVFGVLNTPGSVEIS
jgi:hypothetical protein